MREKDRDMETERGEGGVREQDRKGLNYREASGGKITQGVGEIWVVISLSSSKCLFAPDVSIKY